MAPTFYKCKCGASFATDLGKYGCPNCTGEKPARLHYLLTQPLNATECARIAGVTRATMANHLRGGTGPTCTRIRHTRKTTYRVFLADLLAWLDLPQRNALKYLQIAKGAA